LTEPDCDDGNPDTDDSYDAANCACVNESNLMCTDPCANNTGAAEACTYDPDYNVCDDGDCNNQMLMTMRLAHVYSLLFHHLIVMTAIRVQQIPMTLLRVLV